MTNRSDSGAGSLGGDDTELDRGITGSSAGSTGSGLGSTDVGGSDFGASASGGDLGMGTGTATGHGAALGSVTDTGGTLGSTMGAGELGSGSTTLGGDIRSSETDVVEITTIRPEVHETTSSSAYASETTSSSAYAGRTTGQETNVQESSGGGGMGGSLPGAAIGALAGAAIGAAASALMGSGSQAGSSNIERSIEVNVPVSTAYNQWTQFEEFPRFMQGVERVQQLDDKRLHWHADIGFKDKEWTAEIVDQVPDQRVAWRSTSGAPNGGVVTFHPVDANRTRVTLRIDYSPKGFVENVGDTLGLVSRRVEGDLERFKEFIESRGMETGGWRGEIHRGQ